MAVESIYHMLFDNLKTKLAELTWANTINLEHIKLFSSQFDRHEFPVIQIFDTGGTSRTLQGRTEEVWDFSVELILYGTEEESADQGLLFDRMLEIKRKIGEDPYMGLGQILPSQGRFKHVKLVRRVTDLHLMQPHLWGRLDWQALFEEPFHDEC